MSQLFLDFILSATFTYLTFSLDTEVCLFLAKNITYLTKTS